MQQFPLYKQHDSMLCGITCLRMVCKHFGVSYSAEFLSSLCIEGREGISLLALSKGSTRLGLKNECGLVGITEIQNILPCILHWNQNHFVVLYKVKKNRFYIADNTKIGRDGVGLSQGQKQRILIARAVYKNPDYIFLDEATNSLDANNERMIVEHLDEFYKGKTVVIVAHRLSTVKNANQIVVLDKGKVVETGNHESLTAKRGAYYNLVKNQLELGN